ncbi:hypothetical protein MAPG_10613 [Magnaporthiopsis poae ATCC 64411]|uniref:Uncharacterized protein n=1 Tax=Magnaporthiopsis poae (strain ATCC 64411 / 73-15) TaxID=644358 RepID=A0A0C4ED21_MAGP6|nr:hypothetical protein MAPG_10613 [Magnaporthiopsis poae ATCC 64411]
MMLIWSTKGPVERRRWLRRATGKLEQAARADRWSSGAPPSTGVRPRRGDRLRGARDEDDELFSHIVRWLIQPGQAAANFLQPFGVYSSVGCCPFPPAAAAPPFGGAVCARMISPAALDPLWGAGDDDEPPELGTAGLMSPGALPLWERHVWSRRLHLRRLWHRGLSRAAGIKGGTPPTAPPSRTTFIGERVAPRAGDGGHVASCFAPLPAQALDTVAGILGGARRGGGVGSGDIQNRGDLYRADDASPPFSARGADCRTGSGNRNTGSPADETWLRGLGPGLAVSSWVGS